MIAPSLLLLLNAAPLCAPSALVSTDAAPQFQSTGATGAADGLARGQWLIDEENDEVLLVRPDGGLERHPGCGWPQALVALSDGRVIASCRQDGALLVLGGSGPARRVAVGVEPSALAVDELTRRAWVGLVTAREVVTFDLDRLEVSSRAPLRFQPTALALRGSALVVAGRDAPQLTVLDADTLDEGWSVTVPSRGHAVGRVTGLVVHQAEVLAAVRFVDTGLAAPPVLDQGGYGGAHNAAPFGNVALFRLPHPDGSYAPLDLAAQTALADVSALGSGNGKLWLASRGSRRLEVLGEPRPMAGAPSIAAMSIDPEGRSVALDTHRRRVLFDDGTHTRALDAPPSKVDPELRRGRELFEAIGDARVSARALGCASCHPDGRDDGLVWRLQGTARQTPMLAGRRLTETAPYNWLGSAPTLEENVRQTVQGRLLGRGLEADELAALTRYLREGLRPVQAPRPALEPSAVELGRELFTSATVGCASCHPPDFAFTDGTRHDVQSFAADERPDLPRSLLRLRDGTVAALDNPELPSAFDTPSLVGVALTAPYFHDGSARTLREVIEQNHDRMGSTSALSATEVDALVAYLSTL
ncbi:MAG: c-type cytochrome [Archangiaceae bacterium]|nr:c-type cytochrome [Archangiaceae bacterium]